DYRKCRLVQAPVDLGLWCVREEVQGQVELSGEEAAAAGLRTQPALLDQVLRERVALGQVLQEGSAAGGRRLVEAAHDTRGGEATSSARPRMLFVEGWKSRPADVTSPAGRPRRVTGAPTLSPRSDSVK